jgi:hypothetical protein
MQLQIHPAAVPSRVARLCLIAIRLKIMLPVPVARLFQTLDWIALFIHFTRQIVITPFYYYSCV